MMKNRKKLPIFVLSALSISLTAGVISLGSNLITSVVAYNVSNNSYFTYTDGSGYTYKCYSIEGENDKVAIAWGMNPSDTPTNLTVPSTVIHSESSYDVVAIAKGGFRYCDFQTVSLPHSITEINEEAFAYCE